MERYATVDELIGKTFSKIYKNDDNTEIYFIQPDGSKYIFYHEQDCCEYVWVEDICGDLSTLENSEILKSEESVKDGDLEYDHQTWTFYLFATQKGYVNIRWCGESNGYYSERVDLKFVSA